MKKRNTQLMTAAVLGAAALFTGAALAQGTTFLTIGSGSTTGVYFPVATGMAKMINDSGSGIAPTPVPPAAVSST